MYNHINHSPHLELLTASRKKKKYEILKFKKKKKKNSLSLSLTHRPWAAEVGGNFIS